MQANPRSGNPGVQQGIIFGVALGVISIIGNLITIFTRPAGGLAFLISAVFLIITLFGYAYAGYRASAITGRVGTGAIAGLIAGLIAGIIGAILSFILIFTGVTAVTTGAVSHSFLIVGAIIGVILGLAIALGIGAGLGAIGGAIGKSRAPQGQQYQEPLYQGMPPPAQGPYQQGPYQQGPYQGTPPQNPPPPPNNYPGNYQ
ncbi:MAG: hypothetical protein NVSMB49_13230 [Ktedonobacteraceae bacterium]